MNLPLIQQLKTAIQCTTPQALKLLKQTENNVTQAEQLFHEQNLALIQQQADCDRELAERFYHICNNNAEKAIQKAKDWIFNGRLDRSVITTADDKYYPSGPCFVFYGKDNDDKYLMNKENIEIEKVYMKIPIEDVWEFLYNKDINMFEFYYDPFYDDVFSPYFSNQFTQDDISQLIENLQKAEHTNPKAIIFYQELADWLINCKALAHHLVIYGNV